MRRGPLLLILLTLALPAPAAPQAAALAIASVQTLGDGAGHIHGLVVHLTQPAETVALDVSQFQVTGCTCANLRATRGPDPAQDILLWFDPTGTSATLPSVRYTATDATRIRSGGLVLPDDAAPHVATDGAMPVVASFAYTSDAASGLVSGVDLTFSEPVRDASVQAALWTLGGAAATGASTGAAADDAMLHLAFPESAQFPTGSSPRLVAAIGAVADLAGNPLAPFDSAPPTPMGTSPVRLLSATVSGFARNDVHLTFSAPVQPTEDSHSQLFASDLAYLDRAGGGASALAAVTAAGPQDLTVTLNAPFAFAGEGVDAVAVREGTLKDGSGAVLPFHSVPLHVDTAPPVRTPLAPTASATSAHAVQVAWTPPDTDVAYVEVRRASTAITPATLAGAQLVQRSTGTSLSVTGLAPLSEQHFAFQAVDFAGNRGPLFTARAMTPADTTPPAAPTALQAAATNVSGGSLVLDWRAPADDDGSAIASYDLRMAAAGADPFAAGSVLPPPAPAAPGTPQHALVTGLAAGLSYTLGLRATDTAGNVGPAATVQVTLPAAGPVPPAFTARVPGHEHPSSNRTATVRWGNLTGAPTFRAAIDQSPNRTLTLLDPVATSPFIVTGLADGTWYAHVAAFNAAGQAASPTVAFTIDTTPPTSVTDLAVANVSASQVVLRWSAPGDGGAAAASYDLRWVHGTSLDASLLANSTRVSGLPLPAAPGTAQQVSVALAPNQTYAFTLRAGDAAGNLAGPSNVAVATTRDDHTPPVGIPTVSAPSLDGLGPRDAAFAWTPATDPESPVGYIVSLTRGDGGSAPAAITTQRTNATFRGLEPGAWTVHVRPTSSGGAGSEGALAFTVAGVDADAAAAANAGIVLRVTRSGATNTLTWTLPARLPATVDAVRVWASNSPYVLVATLKAGSPEFQAARFQHTGDAARATTHYLVTLALAGAEAEPTPNVVLGAQGIVPQAASSWLAALLPAWAWWAGGAASLLLVAAGVLLLRRRGARPAQGPAAAAPAEASLDMDSWVATPQEPVEQVQCHACPTVFEVRGVRPLETVCTACGARGLLD